MTFKELIDLTRDRLNLEEEEMIGAVLNIIKSGINHAYMFDMKKFTPDVKTTKAPVVNGAANLPEDIDEILKIYPMLTDDEKRVGNVILSERAGTVFDIVYISAAEELKADGDAPSIPSKYHYLLSTFACYSYYSYRKKTEEANVFLQEYLSRQMLIRDDPFSYDQGSIIDVTGW